MISEEQIRQLALTTTESYEGIRKASEYLPDYSYDQIKNLCLWIRYSGFTIDTAAWLMSRAKDEYERRNTYYMSADLYERYRKT